MRKKITPILKREITQKWLEQFPSIGKYKDMWLMNICGPLLIGIILDYGTDKTIYEPSLHIHNLCIDSDYVSLIATIDAPYVNVDDTADAYLNDVEIFKKETYIALEGDIVLADLVENMKQYYKKAKFKPEVLLTLVCLAVWSGSNEIYDNTKYFLHEHMEDFDKVLPAFKDKWLSELPKSIDECEKLRHIVYKQENKLKLTKLPHREMII